MNLKCSWPSFLSFLGLNGELKRMFPYSYPSFARGADSSENAAPSRIFDGFATSPVRSGIEYAKR